MTEHFWGSHAESSHDDNIPRCTQAGKPDRAAQYGEVQNTSPTFLFSTII